MGGFYLVVKTIKRNRYYYYQRTWREGSKVKCECCYVGPVVKIARPPARLASSAKASMNAGMNDRYPGDPAAEGRLAAWLDDLERLRDIDKSTNGGTNPKRYTDHRPPLPTKATGEYRSLAKRIAREEEIEMNIKEAVIDSHAAELQRHRVEIYNFGAVQEDRTILSKTSKGDMVTTCNEDGTITHEWCDTLTEAGLREARAADKAIAEKGYYESPACRERMARMEKESEKTRLICLYDKLTRPYEGSIYTDAQREFVARHAKAIEEYGADALNLAWALGDFTVCSKTDKGILTSTIHPHGEITHTWDAGE